MSWRINAHRQWLFGAWILLSATAPAAETFRDCAGCSRMVAVRGGTFTMGSPADEPERKKFEGPRSDVQIAPFAIGETEVTRGQYATFVKETRRQPPANGCFTFAINNTIVYSTDVTDQSMDPHASWRNPGFKQTDKHPVTCISWHDAADYAEWLAHKTGKPYRLPSEAEWEYAARAGSTSTYFWGQDEEQVCPYANVGDPSLLRVNPIIRGQVETALSQGNLALRFVHCTDGTPYTSPVGSYKPNKLGLYDMIGNVWEYVADCWQEALPENGIAHEATPCDYRRVRGGSWDDSPPELRSARRSRVKPDVPRNDGGFRLARDLDAAEIARAMGGK